MNKNTLLLIVPAVLLVGCSTFSEPERPVATAKHSTPKKSSASTKAPVAKKSAPPVATKRPEEVPGSATYAIEAPSTQFKIEPSLPTFRAEPLIPPADVPAQQAMPSPPVAPSSLLNPVPMSPGAPALPSGVAPVPSVAAVVPAQLMPAYVPEEAKIPSGTAPAVLALLSEADRNRGSGDLDAAVVAMERALRIDSRNPTLTYKLAQLRIKQNKPQLAEELAGKAALLAGSDLDLKRKSWLMIAEARRMQQNVQGAKEAKIKAESFFGH